MNSNSLRHYDILISILGTLGATGLVWYLAKRIRRLVRNNGETIINGTFWVLERALKRSISAGLSMRRYCITQLSNESGKFLQVPGSQNLALNVDDVFVPLTLQLGGRNKTFTNVTLLDAGSRLVVVGDPGCGKSTLIKRVFRDTCHDTLLQPSAGRLPIRLELKNLAPSQEVKNEADAGKWLMENLRGIVSKVEGFEMGRLFDIWSVDAGLLVLLDGLDEVSSEKYPVVAAAIRGLSQLLAELTPNNAIILTMRIQFHQQVHHEFEEAYPQTMYVRQFLPNEIFTFLNKWPFDKDQDTESQINRIYADLTDRPTLREMCSNPLVLAMYVENDSKSDRNDAPDTRTQFYEKVVTELLIKRRRRQAIITGRSIGLRNQREEILGELALENLLDPNQPANSISWVKAISLTQNICGCDDSEAEVMLRELAAETGLISEERPGESIRFIHLTFCEFMAANQCAKGRDDGWEVVIDTHRNFVLSGESQLQTRLVEVLPFAHALLPRIRRSRALSDVASLNDRLVLGRCFLETQLYSQPEWSRYLHDEREYLASMGEDGWNEGEIRRLHLFGVVVRDATEWHADVVRTSVGPELESVFTDIVKGSSEILAKVFATYASQDAAAAVRLAEQVGINMLTEFPNLLVESCQEEPFLAHALAGLKTPSVNLWIGVVAESALLYSNVAYRLDSMEASSVRLDVEGNWKHKKLFRLGTVRKGSWYYLLLSSVLGDANIDRRFSAINIIKNCAARAPYHYLAYRFRHVLSIGIAFLSLMVFSAVAGLFPMSIQNYLDVLAFVLAALIGVGSYSLAYDIRWLYMALFGFVRPLDGDSGNFYPARVMLRFKIIRNSFLTLQADSLAQITTLRQVDPYPTLRHFYPPQARR
jgi:hypothetical protein